MQLQGVGAQPPLPAGHGAAGCLLHPRTQHVGGHAGAAASLQRPPQLLQLNAARPCGGNGQGAPTFAATTRLAAASHLVLQSLGQGVQADQGDAAEAAIAHQCIHSGAPARHTAPAALQLLPLELGGPQQDGVLGALLPQPLSGAPVPAPAPQQHPACRCKGHGSRRRESSSQSNGDCARTASSRPRAHSRIGRQIWQLAGKTVWQGRVDACSSDPPAWVRTNRGSLQCPPDQLVRTLLSKKHSQMQGAVLRTCGHGSDHVVHSQAGEVLAKRRGAPGCRDVPLHGHIAGQLAAWVGHDG